MYEDKYGQRPIGSELSGYELSWAFMSDIKIIWHCGQCHKLWNAVYTCSRDNAMLVQLCSFPDRLDLYPAISKHWQSSFMLSYIHLCRHSLRELQHILRSETLFAMTSLTFWNEGMLSLLVMNHYGLLCKNFLAGWIFRWVTCALNEGWCCRNCH